jgi:hypothetical protein
MGKVTEAKWDWGCNSSRRRKRKRIVDLPETPA